MNDSAHLANPPSIYLCGPIRDAYPEDVIWRETVCKALEGVAIILNPLAGHTQHTHTEKWHQDGVPVMTRAMVKRDLWLVDRADIIVCNLMAMATDYKGIGSMQEIGRATIHGALIFSVTPENIKQHPFIEENFSEHFDHIDDLLSFLTTHVLALSGEAPNFGGYTQ